MNINAYAMNGKLASLCTALVMAAAFAAPAHAAAPEEGGAQRVIDFTSCAKPVYPKADLQAKHEGTVKMEFKLDDAGNVTGSKVTTSSGFPALDEAARSAIAKCRFSPAKAGVKSDDAARVQYVWMLH